MGLGMGARRGGLALLGLLVLVWAVGGLDPEAAGGGEGAAAGEEEVCKTTEAAVPTAGKAALLIGMFEGLKAHPLGWFGFIILLTVWTAVALPVTPMEVCAGFVFGPLWGTVGSLLAKTLGCCCALTIGRLVGRSQGWKIPEAMEKYMSFLLKSPLQAMCVVRIAPIPLGVKNYGLSLVPFPGDRYPVAEYVWACILVGAPFSIVWCFTGHGAGSLVEIVSRYS